MYIAIDVGGSNIRVATFDSLEDPKILEVEHFKNTNNYPQDLENMTQAIQKIASGKIEGIGIGVAGPLDEDKSYMKAGPNIPNWAGKPLKADLEKTFQCPVLLENDAAIAALGEALFGHGKRKNFNFIIWGTGVGGTAVQNVNGKITLTPFEAGHQVIESDSKIVCGCGQNGCLEGLCSGGNIKVNYQKRAATLTEEEWEEVCQRFAQGMLNIIAIRPTNLMLFAGGVAVDNPNKIKKVQEIVKNRLKIYPLPEFKVAKLGRESGLFGALGLFKIR